MRCSSLNLVLLAVVITTGEAWADDPTGTWKVHMTFEGRSGRVSVLKLRLAGETLTGEMLRSQGGESAIENARYDDGTITFDVAREWNGQRFTTRYSGVFAGDRIKGTTQSRRRGRVRTVNWEATRTTAEELAQELDTPPVAADIDLNDQNYQVWRDHILPAADELAWERIPWLTTFKDGILAADNEEKPLLLWTMNGHPLGCT